MIGTFRDDFVRIASSLRTDMILGKDGGTLSNAVGESTS
jgi:hypothetical protein